MVDVALEEDPEQEERKPKKASHVSSQKAHDFTEEDKEAAFKGHGAVLGENSEEIKPESLSEAGLELVHKQCKRSQTGKRKSPQ